MAALNFVEKCLGHGVGIMLRVTDSGYNFESLGGGSSVTGPSGPNAPRPSPDQVAAAQAYQSIDPNALGSHAKF